MNCPVCGTKSIVKYSNVKDNFFFASGRWNVRSCIHRNCNLLWVDPQPSDQTLNEAYKNYYTHDINVKDSTNSNHTINLPSIFHQIATHLTTNCLDKDLYSSRQLLFLDRILPGRMLDIGCGSGQLMVSLKSTGWDAEGQEVDMVAAGIARSHGFIVHTGQLTKLKLLPCSYDAITMNHVIEHISNPVEIFTCCYHLLKPGGLLIITTPNSISLGHDLFGKDWRGLEVPRHIYIYSLVSLSNVAKNAGFDIQSGFTHGACFSIIYESLCSKFNVAPQTPKAALFIFGIAFRAFSFFLQLLNLVISYVGINNKGEECVLILRKS